MRSAQYAKYFIRTILAICAIAIIFTIFHVITPKIDVFSCVGVHWTAEHPQEVTCTFHPDFFAEKVLELKPKADIQDVENLAKSIQVKVFLIKCKKGKTRSYPFAVVSLLEQNLNCRILNQINELFCCYNFFATNNRLIRLLPCIG